MSNRCDGSGSAARNTPPRRSCDESAARYLRRLGLCQAIGREDQIEAALAQLHAEVPADVLQGPATAL